MILMVTVFLLFNYKHGGSRRSSGKKLPQRGSFLWWRAEARFSPLGGRREGFSTPSRRSLLFAAFEQTRLPSVVTARLCIVK